MKSLSLKKKKYLYCIFSTSKNLRKEKNVNVDSSNLLSFFFNMLSNTMLCIYIYIQYIYNIIILPI